MAKQKLNINPLVLKWLRGEFQLSEAEMAKKMRIKKVERYALMESGSVSPSLNQLRSLSRSLKVPLMMFYLKRIPDGGSFPVDYRRRSDAAFSPKSVTAIRRGHLIQDLMSTFSDWQETRLQIFKDLEPSEASKVMRDACSYSPKKRISRDTLFSTLRETIESFGIVTLTLSFKKEEMRGFSLIGEPSVIAVSGSDAKSSQIFTLLHELFHVISNQDGVCQPLSSGLKPIEGRCNQFAASFLMTPEELKESLCVNGGRDDNNLRRIADQYKTSREVVLIEMIEIGLATWNDYESKSTIWQREYKKQAEEAFYPQADPIRRIWRENGRGVTLKILEQLSGSHITQSDAAHYLNAKASYVDFIVEESLSRA